jgi:hypothetical protein
LRIFGTPLSPNWTRSWTRAGKPRQAGILARSRRGADGDNESAVGQWRGGNPQLTAAMNAFRGCLGIKVVQCRPGDPEAKGLVELANGYLGTSFLLAREVQATGAVPDEHQDIDPLEHNGVHRKEVTRDHVMGLGGHELPPGRPGLAWRWMHSSCVRNRPPRRGRNLVTEAAQFALDPPIPHPGLSRAICRTNF